MIPQGSLRTSQGHSKEVLQKFWTTLRNFRRNPFGVVYFEHRNNRGRVIIFDIGRVPGGGFGGPGGGFFSFCSCSGLPLLLLPLKPPLGPPKPPPGPPTPPPGPSPMSKIQNFQTFFR